MSTDMVDLASVEASVTPTAEVTPAATETPSTSTTNDSELSVIDASSEQHEEESTENETTKADGTERTPEEREQYKAEQTAKAAGTGTTTTEQRNALKALRDLDPKYAKVVKEMHGSVERWAAAKELLGVGEGSGIVGLKNLLAAHGAKSLPELSQALVNQNHMIDTVKATDELLYSGDKQLWSNVYEDLKAQGKEDMYGKNAENMLEHLKSVDPDGYYRATSPSMVSDLDRIGMPAALNQMLAALKDKNTDKASGVLNSVIKWWNELSDDVSATGKSKSEMSKLEAAKAEWQGTQDKAERTKVESGIAENCEKSNNVLLGKVLGGFLRMPFFKDFPHDTKVDLGNGIKDNLYAALKADKSYQQSMKTLWGAKIPNRAQMVQVHEDWLRTHGDQIVRDTVTKRYPGYAKGGSAAGKAAAAVTKKADASKAATQSIATMRPIYVASRPENLVRDSVRVGGKEYNGDQLQVLQIQGKGFVRTTDGKGLKFVSWRKS